MPQTGASQHPIRSIDLDGQRVDVSLRTAFDGVEYVGKLWFQSEGSPALPDHGPIVGPSVEATVEAASALTTDDLERRCRRAHAEKRRYLSLRRATGELLAKVKYMNRVAVSMRAGVIDGEGAAQELELIEQQMIEIVQQFRALAGIEG